MLRLFARTASRPVRQLQSGTRRCLAVYGGEEDGEGSPARFEKSVNQVNLLGRVGRDAELRGTEAHPVVVFSLATNNVYTKAGGGTVSRVDWHRISVFKPGLRDKVAINLRKGDRVFVNGTIRYDEYTDNEENLVRTTTILASDLVNLTKRFMSDEEGSETMGSGF
ncbi:single-stranded DNA-binding protein, mitochondrial-like [Babylonia areolata]|uniref:single-stranded DNA-binding protein, mitochondrial-like n=1 Tax=Babylonia areolata TaxID=304850 RepID=UPI003FD55918